MIALRCFVLLFIFFSTAAPPLAQQRSLIDDFIVREAETLENTLQATWPTRGKDAKTWRADGIKALNGGDARAATGAFASSVILEKANGDTWLQLARAYLAIETEKYGEKNTFARNAGASAYLAFLRSSTPATKAQALAVLAQALGVRELWRPALRAYKASLALVSDPTVQSEYDQMFSERGFRYLDYTSDNESSSPRVCMQFSEQLAKGRSDFANFVTVNNDKPAAVKVQGQQLCVEELVHGKRYDVKVRSGLPSVEGDFLPKPIDITVYVRDRKPSVRFTARNYVLPRTGQQGIPIVSTNTKAVKATIYRVGDRRIAAEVLDGDFAKQLETYQLTEVASKRGEKLWSGQMAVVQKLNEEVTTAFPIDTLLPNLKPGLYIMSATAGEEEETSAEAVTDEYSNESYQQKATQWFVVSDLGITAFSGQDGIHVFVRSLATADVLPDIDVRLIARNNEVLATAKTDARGVARFEDALTRGTGGLAPALVVARGADIDYGFLDITKQSFDLSDRGVAGRNAPGPLDALVFTERGVYRPGETINATVLLRDAAANAVPNTPLLLKLFRPDGVEYRRETVTDKSNGGRSWSVPLPQTAMTGTWRISAFVDPKAAALFERSLLVEDYVPERLEMKLTASRPTLASGAPAAVTLSGRYLYGAPASNLGIEGEVVISAASEIEGFPGYEVGQSSEKFTAVRKDLESLPNTDATGVATLSVPLPELSQTSKPLKATATIRLREPSGRALQDRIALKVNTGKSYIGVKPSFSGTVPEGETAKFEVIGIGADGKQAAMAGLKWELHRVENRYQWYSRDNRWSYELITYESRVGGGTLDVTGSTPAKIESSVEPGNYRLDVTSTNAQGPATSLTFSAGWYVSEASDTPEILDIALDKAKYQAGDNITVRILPRMAGKAMIAIVSDKILSWQTLNVDATGGSATFKMDPSWGPGAYATATLYRPMDSAAKRMPSRAVGVKWIPLDAKPRELSVSLETPASVRPAGPVTVSATVSGLNAGEKASVVVSGVDVGILNLTRYKTPQPSAYFLGQRRLGLEMRDLYGKLIDGMQGVRGAVRSGGDGGGMDMGGRPLAEAPLAVYSGIVETGADGKTQVTFTLPPFNGTMRLAAQAWTATKAGHGEKDVIIRDTVVAQATPPKFLTLGDTSNMHLSLENVEAEPGQYRLTAKAEGALTLTGTAERTVTLDRNKRISATIPIKAATAGEGVLSFALSGGNNVNIERKFKLTVEPPALNVRRRTLQVLAASTGSLRVGPELVRDLVPASAKVSVVASRTAAFDVPGLLLSLDRYPYGCAEQTTSRAFPLLYYNEVASKARITRDGTIKTAIEKAITRLYEMQSSSGSFGLWGPGQDLWLTAYITDFFIRAKEKGYAIREVALEGALDRLKNTVNNSGEFQKGGEDLAYALYVLTRAGRGVLGDLRYYADTKLDSFSTPLAKAQIAASLAMLGDKDRADRTFSAAVQAVTAPPPVSILFERSDYGTQLRDAAAILALMGETNTGAESLQRAVGAVTALRSRQRDTTTQEGLWLLLAARTLDAQNRGLSLEVNGTPVQGAFETVLAGAEFGGQNIQVTNVSSVSLTAGTGRFDTVLSGDQFARDGLQIRNKGADVVPTQVLVSGEGLEAEPSAESGFKIERKTYTPDGREIAFDKIKQNERIVVVLKATEIDARMGQIVIEDRLPAGFDIENPQLIKGSDLKAFSWLPSTYVPSFTSFRDDRFVAAYSLRDTARKTPAQLTLAYVMRAVNPGVYTHAGARVEDMYRPDRFGRTSGSKVEVVAAP